MKNLTEGEKMVCRDCETVEVQTVFEDMPTVSCGVLGRGEVESYIANGGRPSWCPLETAKEVMK